MSTSTTEIKNAAKQLNPRPKKKTVKATVTRLIHDIDRTRKTKSTTKKRKVLLRIGKLVSRAAYATILIGALKVAFDLKVNAGQGFRKVVENYATGTLKPATPAPGPASIIATKASTLYEYSDYARDLYEAAEFWYEKLGNTAKVLGGYVAWRANPQRRLRS